METIRFPYRSARHLALLNVVAESGGWKKQGLKVDYNFYVAPEEAHKLLRTGKVQFIGGNHITPYIKRASGDDWIYVGQTANYIGQALVVRKDGKIRKLEDLRGKKLGARGSGGPHTRLNAWLTLKKSGLENSGVRAHPCAPARAMVRLPPGPLAGPFGQKNAPLVKRFLKGLAAGIRYFKAN